MKNVQITIDEETLERVDRAAEPLGLTRSEIIRRALREWLHRDTIKTFEEEWIKALKTHPDQASRAEDWSSMQTWSKK